MDFLRNNFDWIKKFVFVSSNPNLPEPNRTPTYEAEAAVLYGTSLVKATFTVVANGVVTMKDDKPNY